MKKNYAILIVEKQKGIQKREWKIKLKIISSILIFKINSRTILKYGYFKLSLISCCIFVILDLSNSIYIALQSNMKSPPQ